jgi:hypothetical protein
MSQPTAASDSSGDEQQTYAVACALASAAAAQEVLQKPDVNHTDIWNDAVALHCLQEGSFPSDVSAAEKSRVNKRLQYYTWRDGKLLRVMPDSSTRVVPPPADACS